MAFLDKHHNIRPNSVRVENIDNSETPFEIVNAVGTSQFKITPAGVLTVGGTQTFTGATTFSSTIAATGAATLTGGVAQASAPSGFPNWQPSAATSGTDTACASGTQQVTSIFIPVNMTLTGIAYLIGSVGGTDKVYAVLYDAAGAVLANSSLTAGGATVGTAANIQTLAFTATYAAIGPRIYHIGISLNGATARIRTVPAHCQAGLWGGTVAQVHGTVAAIAPPSTFTADEAPVVYVY